jgi:pyruvate dehydrogenase E2 component (dihydrolipoamide acetyltransferase)
MSEIVAMPKLGFDMAEGTLVRWVKRQGEQVNKGDVLAEIETDKATVEVESTASGLVAAQFVAEGAVVPVGDPIAVIAAPGESVDVDEMKKQAGGPPPDEGGPPAPAAPRPSQAAEAAQPRAPAGPAPADGKPPAAPAMPEPATNGQQVEVLASPFAR